MRSEPARSCARCHSRIAPYDLLTVYNKTPYHQHCFLLQVREEADRSKTRTTEAEPKDAHSFAVRD
jgi:hypothetical protein